MKIVQLIMSRQFRGAEVFAAQLSKELVLLGEDVRYVSLYEAGGREFIPDGVLYYDFSAKRVGGLNLTLLKRLRQFLKKHQPDVVQANAGDTLKYAVLVKWMFGFSYKIIFRNASMVSQYLKTYPQKIFTSFLFRQTDYVLSVSEKTKADLVYLYPFCQAKTEVIPIGISPKKLKRLDEFGSGNVNLVHVGGFTFEKNHKGLLRIFSEVKTKIPNALLWLVGDGPLSDKIKLEVNNAGLNKSVVFTGAVPNSLDYIHSANVLLLPSHIEGLPGVILEAYFGKTPVVAYRVGGVSDVVEDGKTGWLVEKDDEIEFVRKIMEILESSERASQVVEHAYHFVVGQFDNTLIAKRFLKVYQQLK